jgi:hypothetical protein
MLKHYSILSGRRKDYVYSKGISGAAVPVRTKKLRYMYTI